jgi:hypothetical protein
MQNSLDAPQKGINKICIYNISFDKSVIRRVFYIYNIL